MATLSLYVDSGRYVSRSASSLSNVTTGEIITAAGWNTSIASDTISAWSDPGGTWGISNGIAYNIFGEIITVKDLNAAVSGDIANSYEPTKLETTKRFDDFLAIAVANARDLSVDGVWHCDVVPYTPTAPGPKTEPEPEPEPDTPLVPTDVQVPDNFRVEEYLCVRMHFDRYGEFEDDTELWSTPAGAQGRIRQILFDRDDVVSCEVVTVWRREKA